MRMLQEVPRILLMQTLISGFEVVMLKAKFQFFFCPTHSERQAIYNGLKKEQKLGKQD